MFLALKEIRHEKLRYGLIVAMITLIGYLLFILSGLMNGLARENTAAITGWQTQTVLLNKDANDSLSQSLITREQLPKQFNNHHEALVGQLPLVVTTTGKSTAPKQTVQFIGLQKNQFIYQHRMQITQGHRPENDHQVVLDESLKAKGYRLGTRVRLNSSASKYQVVGFAKDAKISIAPIAYGSLKTWQTLHGGDFAASGIVSDQTLVGKQGHGLKSYTIDQFIHKLPGYTAQNSTFEMMIGFLMVISLVVIAVFLYILTMQKTQQYAILRAQGIPGRTLVWATIAQSLILMVSGVILAGLLTLATMSALPIGVPVSLAPSLAAWMAITLIVIGMAGSILPAIMIERIDPLDALK